MTLYAPSGTVSFTLSEPSAVAWVVRLSAYQPAGTAVTMQASIGSGQAITVPSVSPAVAAAYAANLFAWMPVVRVGKTPSVYGTPANWPDPFAWWLAPDAAGSTADGPGMWLLRKWIFVPSQQGYTVSLAAASAASLYVDGTLVVSAQGISTTTQGVVNLTAGYHLVTVDVTLYGVSPAQTGVLLSIANASGSVLEDGQHADWETSGWIGNPWSFASGAAPLLTDSWYILALPDSTSVDVTLTLAGSGTATPQVNNLWWYSVAPWKWDAGGAYDATSPAPLPVNTTTVEVT